MECLGAFQQNAVTGEPPFTVRLALPPRVYNMEGQYGMRLVYVTSSSGLPVVNRHPDHFGGSARDCGVDRAARASIPLVTLCKEVSAIHKPHDWWIGVDVSLPEMASN